MQAGKPYSNKNSPNHSTGEKKPSVLCSCNYVTRSFVKNSSQNKAQRDKLHGSYFFWKHHRLAEGWWFRVTFCTIVYQFGMNEKMTVKRLKARFWSASNAAVVALHGAIFRASQGDAVETNWSNFTSPFFQMLGNDFWRVYSALTRAYERTYFLIQRDFDSKSSYVVGRICPSTWTVAVVTVLLRDISKLPRRSRLADCWCAVTLLPSSLVHKSAQDWLTPVLCVI